MNQTQRLSAFLREKSTLQSNPTLHNKLMPCDQLIISPSDLKPFLTVKINYLDFCGATFVPVIIWLGPLDLYDMLCQREREQRLQVVLFFVLQKTFSDHITKHKFHQNLFVPVKKIYVFGWDLQDLIFLDQYHPEQNIKYNLLGI
jgi:hypothetical protein